MYKIKRYFSGVIKQAKMVRWPKRTDMMTAFAVVLVIISISAVALSLDDFIIARLLQTLEEQFGTVDSSSSAALKFITLIKTII